MLPASGAAHACGVAAPSEGSSIHRAPLPPGGRTCSPSLPPPHSLPHLQFLKNSKPPTPQQAKISSSGSTTCPCGCWPPLDGVPPSSSRPPDLALLALPASPLAQHSPCSSNPGGGGEAGTRRPAGTGELLVGMSWGALAASQPLHLQCPCSTNSQGPSCSCSTSYTPLPQQGLLPSPGT